MPYRISGREIYEIYNKHREIYNKQLTSSRCGPLDGFPFSKLDGLNFEEIVIVLGLHSTILFTENFNYIRLLINF